MIHETQSKARHQPIEKPAVAIKRVGYVDIAKGIGIILVVMAHNDFALISPFAHKLIYSFHMPMFFSCLVCSSSLMCLSGVLSGSASTEAKSKYPREQTRPHNRSSSCPQSATLTAQH